MCRRGWRIPAQSGGDRDLERVARAVVEGLCGEPLAMAERRARALFEAMDFDAARAACGQLEASPDRGPLWVARYLLEAYGRDDDALRIFEAVIADDPANGLAHALLARQYAYRYETQRSREHVAAALRGEPDTSTIALSAIALNHLGDLDAAVAAMERLPAEAAIRQQTADFKNLPLKA